MLRWFAKPFGFIRRHRPLLVALVITAALVIGPGLTVWLRHSLGEARATVADERSGLHRERGQRATAGISLGSTLAELNLVTTQRVDAQAELERTRGALQAVEAELSATTATVGLRGPQAALLGRCLDGVTAALNQSAVFDDGAALTLTAVATVCEQARAAIAAASPQ